MNYFKKSIISGLNEYEEILFKSINSLNKKELSWRPNKHSNNIIFLLWHMILVEDNLINKILKKEERLWIRFNYYEKFPELKNETGFGFSQEKINSFPEMDHNWLLDYYSEVRKKTNYLLENISDNELGLKYSWGDKKISGFFIIGRLITELSQHLGQISYIRGMLRGLNN